MRKFLFLLAFITVTKASAQKIYGTVFTSNGDLLPFSSITIKGTSQGASANAKARYSFSVQPGTYTVVCQHVGYKKEEKTITVKDEDAELTFILKNQQLDLKEVVVQRSKEDPAYEIIRNTIKKRSFYNKQVNGFFCDLYTKDMIKLLNMPEKILGRKIPEEDRKDMRLDSAGKGIVYLSESVAKVFSQQPDKFKMDVISSRVSGSNSFGFTFPSFINLYDNNVKMFSERFNPRGFISPIADGAMGFYKYKLLGTFAEDDKLISTIKVTPRRSYEPLFSGIINIVETEWRIHSLDLTLSKTSQLELLDTLQITQIHVPVGNDIWRVKNQLMHFNFNQFKLDVAGNFLSVYSGYSINPAFDKKTFGNILIQYDTAVNKRSKQYWDTIRPVPLEQEERKDYQVKDSIFQNELDSSLSKRNLDSLNKKQGPLKPHKVFWNGINRTHYSKTNTFSWNVEPLLKRLEYNTVEGLAANLNFSVSKFFRKINSSISLSPHLRYGFSNTHFNAWASLNLLTRVNEYGKKRKRQLFAIAGGKRVSQFNKESPITPNINSINTLFFGDNFMKIYENWFVTTGFTKRYESGLRFSINALYEDRIHLNNSSTFTVFKNDSINITPNFPYERLAAPPPDHQAAILSFDISIKPGQKYIQFPRFKTPIGSKYPTFSFNYTKGLKNILGSDVDFDKWKFTVNDDKNLKLAGTLKYKVGIGGFINNKKVYIQDYQHFNGNRSTAASEYVNSFQLAKYYANSTTANFYSLAHLEHHFNGLLTNKIPLFKRLNWNLVGGSNAFYVNKSNNYIEVFAGLENIFKVIRVDFVAAYQNGNKGLTGIRIGTGGIIGGAVSRQGNSVSISF